MARLWSGWLAADHCHKPPVTLIIQRHHVWGSKNWHKPPVTLIIQRHHVWGSKNWHKSVWLMIQQLTSVDFGRLHCNKYLILLYYDRCFTVAGPSYLSTYVILNWLSCSSSVAQHTSVWWRPQRLVTVAFTALYKSTYLLTLTCVYLKENLAEFSPCLVACWILSLTVKALLTYRYLLTYVDMCVSKRELGRVFTLFSGLLNSVIDCQSITYLLTYLRWHVCI